MRYIQLANTRLTCSALGFGCATLMGKYGRRVSLRALGAAFDQGITYFDVARAYGWGEAERVVGEFARSRRDRVVIASKLGIAPPPMPLWKRLALPAYRTWSRFAKRTGLKGLEGRTRRQAMRHTSDQLKRNLFSVDQAQASLDKSLLTLGVDRIDVLHLHSVHPNDIVDGRLIEFLQGQVAAGKVGYLGAATDPEAAAAIRAAHPAVKIFQMPNTLLDDELARFPDRTVATITHSPLGREQGIERVTRALSNDSRTADWSRRVGYDLTRPAGVASLMLRYAFAANANGVVLCGMHTLKNISANVAIADMPLLEPDPVLEVAREIRDTFQGKFS